MPPTPPQDDLCMLWWIRCLSLPVYLSGVSLWKIPELLVMLSAAPGNLCINFDVSHNPPVLRSGPFSVAPMHLSLPLDPVVLQSVGYHGLYSQ